MSFNNRRNGVANRNLEVTTSVSRPFKNRTNRTLSRLKNKTFTKQIRRGSVYSLPNNHHFYSPLNNVNNGRANIFRVIILYITSNVPSDIPIRLRARRLLYPTTNNRTSNTGTTMDVRRRLFTNRTNDFRDRAVRRLNLIVISLMRTPKTRNVNLTTRNVRGRFLTMGRLFLFTRRRTNTTKIMILRRNNRKSVILLYFNRRDTSGILYPKRGQLNYRRCRRRLPKRRTTPRRTITRRTNTLILVMELMTTNTNHHPRHLRRNIRRFILRRTTFRERRFVHTYHVSAKRRFPTKTHYGNESRLVTMVTKIFHTPSKDRQTMFPRRLASDNFFLFRLLNVVRPRR